MPTNNGTALGLIIDIKDCLLEAEHLDAHQQNPDTKEAELLQAFSSLAKSERVGILAYAIWRGRLGLLRSLKQGPTYRYDKGDASARHTRA